MSGNAFVFFRSCLRTAFSCLLSKGQLCTIPIIKEWSLGQLTHPDWLVFLSISKAYFLFDVFLSLSVPWNIASSPCFSWGALYPTIAYIQGLFFRSGLTAQLLACYIYQLFEIYIGWALAPPRAVLLSHLMLWVFRCNNPPFEKSFHWNV